jgi:transcriptional regulator with XRE-family HTH domain
MNSTFLTNAKDRIREERKRLGLRQEDAAIKCGVKRQQWNRYENGLSVLDGSALRAFTALGADATYILSGVRSTTAEQAVLQRVSTVASELPPEKAQTLFDAAIEGNLFRAENAKRRKDDLQQILVALTTIDDEHFAQAKKQIEQVFVVFKTTQGVKK